MVLQGRAFKLNPEDKKVKERTSTDPQVMGQKVVPAREGEQKHPCSIPAHVSPVAADMDRGHCTCSCGAASPAPLQLLDRSQAKHCGP